MHFQTRGSFSETKVVKCDLGSIYDVIVDLRKTSRTYLNWFGVELNDTNNLMIYIPKGFAHGYMTLAENTHVSYFVDNFMKPATGIKD